jgi:hypothetical protein
MNFILLCIVSSPLKHRDIETYSSDSEGECLFGSEMNADQGYLEEIQSIYIEVLRTHSRNSGMTDKRHPR